MGNMKDSENGAVSGDKMKNFLEDLFAWVEKSLRAGFYLGGGLYLATKAAIILPQLPNYPDWAVLPAVLVSLFGSGLLATKVIQEPTPRQLRKERKEAALNHDILTQNGKRAVRGDG